MKTPLTPEERLFQVIENGGSPPPKGPREKIVQWLKKLFSPRGGVDKGGLEKGESWFKKLSFSRGAGSQGGLEKGESLSEKPSFSRGEGSQGGLEKIGQWLKGFSFSRKGGWKPSLNHSFINRILVICVVLVLMGAAANVLLVKPDMTRVYERVAKANTPPASDQAVFASRHTSDDYVTAILRRNLFEPGDAPVRSTDSEVPATGTDAVLENLELVGISWGKYPEVMIRKKDNGRTYFTRQGKKFDQILIKKILKDRVIVEYKGTFKELM